MQASPLGTWNFIELEVQLGTSDEDSSFIVFSCGSTIGINKANFNIRGHARSQLVVRANRQIVEFVVGCTGVVFAAQVSNAGAEWAVFIGTTEGPVVAVVSIEGRGTEAVTPVAVRTSEAEAHPGEHH